MANAQQQENMLLTEHFTWPPISLIDDIINAVNEVLYRCTDSFETGISSADASLLGFADRYAAEKRTPERDEDGRDVYPEATLEIEEGVLKLETLMENAVDKNFDRLEIWTLRNVLCLPRGEDELARWVRLGHYANIDTAPRDNSLTPEKLYELRRSLLETQKLNAALLAEKQRNDVLIARLKALVQPPVKRERSSTDSIEEASAPFAFLTHTPAAQNLGVQGLPSTAASTAAQTQNETRSTPLSTHTTFSTSQLPYLRQLLAALGPHLSTTALPSTTSSGSATTDVAKASRERKAYVESQSRRILERRGVDTREGVGGEGGRIRGEEVKALEGLVGGLGRGKSERDGKENRDTNGNEEGEEDEGEAMDTS